MALTERQEKGETLARELQEMGAVVTSPLPLADGANLRFRILASSADEILEELRTGDWIFHFVTSGPSFELNGSTPLSHTYEVCVPGERTVIPEDRIPDFPRSTGKKDDNSESAKMLKAWLGAKAKNWR
jgi:hypothetical protein